MDDPIKLEKKRRRFINDLKAGRRKTIGENIVNDKKYKWTEEEYKFLQSFISQRNPNKINNTDICDECVCKHEAYQIIEKHTDKETTIKNYKSRVNTFLKIMNIDNENFSIIFSKSNIQKLIDYILKTYKDPTSYFGFILFMLSKSEKLNNCVPKDTFDKIKKHFDDYKSKQTVKQLQDRHEDVDYKYVYNHIFNKEKEYRKNESGSIKHIISLMYTHALYDNNNIIHMIPRNYFVNIKIVKNDNNMNDNENFYNSKTGRLLINNYKTSGIYEPYDVILNNDVRNIIVKSFEQNPRNYLITQPDGSEYKNNSLSEIIKKYLGYNIDTIRKSIESYEYNIKKTDRTHLAIVSRHTILTQEVSYLAK